MLSNVEVSSVFRAFKARFAGGKGASGPRAQPEPPTSSTKPKRQSWLKRASMRYTGQFQLPVSILPEEQEQEAHRSLQNLPFDVLIRILLCLEVRDMLIVSQTCKSMNLLCNSPFIWKSFAVDTISRSRPLVLKNTAAQLEDIQASELKRTVIRTSFLEDNWNKDKAMRRGNAKKVPLRFPVTSPRSLFYTVFVRKYLLSPTEDRHLTIWDLERGKSIGKYDMRRTFAASGLILAVREHYPTRSLFYIVTGDLLSTDFGHTMQFYILHITFPEDKASQLTTFVDIADFSFSMMQTVAMYILDAVRGIICIVCRYPETDMLGMYVVLDWTTGQSNLINTGLTYEYRKSVLGVRLSSDGGYILIRTERNGLEIQQCHSLALLWEDASPACWKSKLFYSATIPPAHNLNENQYVWSDEADPESRFYQPLFTSPDFEQTLSNTVVFRCWNMAPWWPDYPGAPRPTSCVVLYRTDSTTDFEDGGGVVREQTWRISQYFTSGEVDRYDGDGSSSDTDVLARPIGPFAKRRFIILLHDPVLVNVLDDEMPVLGFSYNQAAWIERTTVDLPPSRPSSSASSRVADGVAALTGGTRRMLARGKPKKRLVARIASFPDPGRCPGDKGYEMENTVKTLDVPQRILAAARDISIDGELGTVSIITKSNIVHIFHYC